MFFEHITENIEKWKEAVIFIRNNNYNPQYCKNGGCPYYEECGAVSIVDKLKSKIRKVKDFQYGSLREAEIKLAEYMEEAMFHNPYDILLLQAQTALGKTTAYCNMIQKYGNKIPFMVVVPTNKLQEEVACELEKRGVPVYLTPNLKESLRRMGLDDLRDEIIQFYERGYGYKVKSRIREYVVENKKRLTEWQLSEFENYLNFKEKLDGSTCVVTTHAMFLGLAESILQNYRIIVDEDILMTVFKNTSSISILELEQLLQGGKLSDRQQRLVVDLLNAEHGSIIHNSCTIDLRADELDNFYEDETLSIYASVSDFLQANTYHVDLENQKVDFFKARKMPYVKMVVVSATLNKALYEGYCPNRKIGYRCIPMAKYRGNIIQYTAYSLSRSNMQDLNFENVLRSAKRIAGKERIPYISFMKYAVDNIYF